jgi:hypothetical protein
MAGEPGNEIPKEYRAPVLYQVQHHGWRYDASGKGHPKLYPVRRGTWPIPVPTTPKGGRSRALANFIGQIRRSGGTWPPVGRD